MSHFAYLMARLNANGRFTLEILSSNNPTRMHDADQWGVLGDTGSSISYDDARKKLVAQIKSGRFGQWVCTTMQRAGTLEPRLPRLS